MSIQIDDTIAALSSAPGPGGRAIVRLSGPRSIAIINSLLGEGTIATSRSLTLATLRIKGFDAAVPVSIFHFPGPMTATGQEVIEVQTIGSPPLVEALLADLLRAGARAAQPGEFSLRGFLAGKLDLPRAEAVLGAIEADNPEELRRSLRQLAGGVSRPLSGLREDLLDLLADLEAGLDFVDEDIDFVGRPELLDRIARGLAQVSLVQKQVHDRGLAGRPFRIVLAGAPNAGKSRLFNALTGGQALVCATPGTTRDYLVARIDLGGVIAELLDTAGQRTTNDELESQAQDLGQTELADADLVLLCVEPNGVVANIAIARRALRVSTKSDLRQVPNADLATSAATGNGLIELKKALADAAQAFTGRGLAPSLSRCRHHVEACLANLRAAHQGVLFNDPAEIVALELRSALEHLGAMTGAVYTDDLLDRVFSRFCIGK